MGVWTERSGASAIPETLNVEVITSSWQRTTRTMQVRILHPVLIVDPGRELSAVSCRCEEDNVRAAGARARRLNRVHGQADRGGSLRAYTRIFDMRARTELGASRTGTVRYAGLQTPSSRVACTMLGLYSHQVCLGTISSVCIHPYALRDSLQNIRSRRRRSCY